MSSLKRIENELKGLEYAPFHIDTPQGRAVVISYCIKTGKYSGENVLLGFSFHGEEGYPEYPPHWIHISPPYDDQLGGSLSSYTCQNDQGDEREWLALSRPPGEIWDDLPTKHIQHYLSLHIPRFCKELK